MAISRSDQQKPKVQNSAMGQLMKMHLERDGHVVTTMSSSMDALAALDVGTRFDMYVLDVQMPPGLRTVCRWRRWWGCVNPMRRSASSPDSDVAGHDDFTGRIVLRRPLVAPLVDADGRTVRAGKDGDRMSPQPRRLMVELPKLQRWIDRRSAGRWRS